MCDDRGLHNKYEVSRTDDSDLFGEKHFGCDLFVLDLTHDPAALVAIAAYSDHCRDTRPILSMELREKAGIARMRLPTARATVAWSVLVVLTSALSFFVGHIQ